VEQIREFLQCDSLRFLSQEGLKRAVGDQGDFCSACFSEEYPIPIELDRSQLDLFHKET
jgi:amidophosphoribosyltransferase